MILDDHIWALLRLSESRFLPLNQWLKTWPNESKKGKNQPNPAAPPIAFDPLHFNQTTEFPNYFLPAKYREGSNLTKPISESVRK